MGRTRGAADRLSRRAPTRQSPASGRSSPRPASQPDVVYAGVEPHALFRSDDRGESFALVEGLWNHPDRPSWMPGGGGACLHTVLPHPTDPDDVLVAMSAAGVYRTRDGGASWAPANRGIQAAFLPEDQRFPEFGQCVHKVAFHPDRPERLFAQNHFGVYRSENRGDSWTPIEDRAPQQLRVCAGRPPACAGDAVLVPAQGRCRAVSTGCPVPRLPDRERRRRLGAARRRGSRRTRTTARSFATRWWPTRPIPRASTSGRGSGRCTPVETQGTAGR